MSAAGLGDDNLGSPLPVVIRAERECNSRAAEIDAANVGNDKPGQQVGHRIIDNIANCRLQSGPRVRQNRVIGKGIELQEPVLPKRGRVREVVHVHDRSAANTRRDDQLIAGIGLIGRRRQTDDRCIAARIDVDEGPVNNVRYSEIGNVGITGGPVANTRGSSGGMRF